MVTFNPRCKTDLNNCLDALIYPQKENRLPFTLDEAHQYVDDIVKFACSIETMAVHTDCYYHAHKLYGEKVARYDRNKYTQYYIIYNVDSSGNIFIERITTNHVTLF